MIEFVSMEVLDFGPIASAVLPMYRQGCVLISGDNRDTTAANDNGSGKSHLGHGLSWCLFGKTIDDASDDSLIRRGQKFTEVASVFREESDEYKVIRKKERGKTGLLRLEHNGADVTRATMKETQEFIVKLLGMDFHTFKNTVLYGQGDIKHFASPLTTDADRKSILKRILRLNVLDDALKASKDAKADLQRKCGEKQTELTVLKTRLEGLGPGVSDVEQQIKEEESRLAELENKVKLRDRWMKVESGVQASLDEFLPIRKQLALERVAVEGAFRELAKADAAVSTSNSSVLTAKRSLDVFKSGKCPTCSTPAEHLGAHLDTLRGSVTAAEQVVIKAKAAQDEARKKHAAAKEQVKVTEARLAEEAGWNAKMVEVKATLKSLSTSAGDLARAKARIKSLKDKAAAGDEARKELEKQIAEVERSIEQHQDDSRHLDFWIKGFGNSGMPSFILDSILPDLTEQSNHYLSILSDGDITVRFDTESKLKSGESRDKFSVVWDVEGIEDSRPSGGQLKKGTISTDLGLMSLVAAREHAAIDLLFMDEVLDGLDATGKARVIDLLTELRKTRSSIFVISHDPALAEMFEKQVVMVKEGQASRLEGVKEDP